MSKTGRPKAKCHFTRTRKGLMRLLFGVDCDVALMPNRRRRECVPIRDKRGFRWVRHGIDPFRDGTVVVSRKIPEGKHCQERRS